MLFLGSHCDNAKVLWYPPFILEGAIFPYQPLSIYICIYLELITCFTHI